MISRLPHIQKGHEQSVNHSCPYVMTSKSVHVLKARCIQLTLLLINVASLAVQPALFGLASTEAGVVAAS
jgi:hypothetical protein